MTIFINFTGLASNASSSRSYISLFSYSMLLREKKKDLRKPYFRTAYNGPIAHTTFLLTYVEKASIVQPVAKFDKLS